uniref:Expressed protein n=1 Tax=Oryza sativa subsp. japonica TaxID=39947 RepID=Q7XCE8_ORYSJ|nr:expressed protein [Oryza sativa Japonica Group]
MRRSLAPRRRAAEAAMAAARNPRNPRRRGAILAAVAPFLAFADYLRLRLVDRAWRLYCRRVGHAPPPFPWLMLPERESPPGAGAVARRVFYDVPGGRSYGYRVPSRDMHRCVATGHGWVVMVAVDAPRRVMLLNPITGDQRIVAWPFARWNARFHAVLTSSPAAGEAGCFLVVVADRLLAFCRPGADFQGWETLRAPGFRHHAALSDVVAVGATVYLVDERRRLWRADLADENPKVQRRDTGFALPFARAEAALPRGVARPRPPRALGRAPQPRRALQAQLGREGVAADRRLPRRARAAARPRVLGGRPAFLRGRPRPGDRPVRAPAVDAARRGRRRPWPGVVLVGVEGGRGAG